MTDETNPQLPGAEQESAAGQSAPRSLGKIWESVVRMGLGEIALRIVTGVALIAMVLLVVWVMSSFYLKGDINNSASPAETAAQATATGEISPVIADAACHGTRNAAAAKPTATTPRIHQRVLTFVTAHRPLGAQEPVPPSCRRAPPSARAPRSSTLPEHRRTCGDDHPRRARPRRAHHPHPRRRVCVRRRPVYSGADPGPTLNLPRCGRRDHGRAG